MKSQVSISKTKSNPGYEEIRAAVGQAINLRDRRRANP
jgi:hypothetical protein